MLIPPSTTQGGDETVSELSELLKGFWCVGEEIGTGFEVFSGMDDSCVNAIIDPVLGKIKKLGDLRHGEVAVNPARMGLTALLHDASF